MLTSAGREAVEEIRRCLNALHEVIREIEREAGDPGNKYRLTNLCAQARHEMALIWSRFKDIK